MTKPKSLTVRIGTLELEHRKLENRFDEYIERCTEKHDKVLDIATLALNKATTAEGRIDKHIHPLYERIEELKADMQTMRIDQRTFHKEISDKIDNNNKQIEDLNIKKYRLEGAKEALKGLVFIGGVFTVIIAITEPLGKIVSKLAN